MISCVDIVTEKCYVTSPHPRCTEANLVLTQPGVTAASFDTVWYARYRLRADSFAVTSLRFDVVNESTLRLASVGSQ